MAAAVVGTLVLGLPTEGAILLLLFQISHALEHRFTAAARANLARLLDSAPTTARVLGTLPSGEADWQRQTDVDANTVAIGCLVAVKPGEMVPLDGVVVSGRALVGAALLESFSMIIFFVNDLSATRTVDSAAGVWSCDSECEWHACVVLVQLLQTSRSRCGLSHSHIPDLPACRFQHWTRVAAENGNHGRKTVVMCC